MRKNHLQKLGLLIFGLVLGLILAEFSLGLFLFSGDEDKFCVWPPLLEQTFEPDSLLFPGIKGTSLFQINENGFRGEKGPDTHKTNFLVLGGSTAECLYLDQQETWPFLIGLGLCRSDHSGEKSNYWVGNAGRSGYSSRHNILEMRHLLPQFPAIDTVLILIGGNDFLRRLHEGENYSPAYDKQELMERTFLIRPLKSYQPWYKRLALWHLIRIQIREYQKMQHKETVQDASGKFLKEWREARTKSEQFIRQLPTMETALEEYQNNLLEIIRLADSLSVEIVLMTQPVMWRPQMSPADDVLLTAGALGLGNEAGQFYSTEALYGGMEMYNEVTRNTAISKGKKLVDLARLIPPNQTMFYDDMHFNEYGAQRVAEEVLRCLRPDFRFSPNSP